MNIHIIQYEARGLASQEDTNFPHESYFPEKIASYKVEISNASQSIGLKRLLTTCTFSLAVKLRIRRSKEAQSLGFAINYLGFAGVLFLPPLERVFLMGMWRWRDLLSRLMQLSLAEIFSSHQKVVCQPHPILRFYQPIWLLCVKASCSSDMNILKLEVNTMSSSQEYE